MRPEAGAAARPRHARHAAGAGGTQFTCITGTFVLVLTSKHKYKRTTNSSKLSTDIRGMQLVQIEFHARYSVYFLY